MRTCHVYVEPNSLRYHKLRAGFGVHAQSVIAESANKRPNAGVATLFWIGAANGAWEPAVLSKGIRKSFSPRSTPGLSSQLTTNTLRVSITRLSCTCLLCRIMFSCPLSFELEAARGHETRPNASAFVGSNLAETC